MLIKLGTTGSKSFASFVIYNQDISPSKNRNNQSIKYSLISSTQDIYPKFR